MPTHLTAVSHGILLLEYTCANPWIVGCAVVKIMVIVLLWLIGVWILWRLDNWARARTSRIPLFGLRGVNGERKKN